MGSTVTLHSAFTLPQLAVIVALPIATAVTLPFSSTVAMLLSDEVHTIVLSVALSGETVAVSCSLAPIRSSISVLLKVTAVASMGSTVTLHSAFTLPQLAVIVALPIATAVTLPFSSTVAMLLSDEVHTTVLSVALSGETVAVSCSFAPIRSSISVLLKVTAVASMGSTVTLHSAFTLPQLAVIVALPIATAVTLPFSSTVAMLLSDEVHTTVLSVVLSGETVAVSCSFAPIRSSISVLFKLTASTSLGSTVTLHSAFTLPQLAVIVALPIATAVTLPFASTVATLLSDDVQTTVLSVALSGDTVAINCSVPPIRSSKDDLFKVTAFASIYFGLTVRVTVEASA